MIDVETYCMPLNASWIPRILNSKGNNWSFFGNHYLEIVDDISNLKYNDSYSFDKLHVLPQFYKNIIIMFCKINQTKKPLTRDDILNMYLWGNKWITYDAS